MPVMTEDYRTYVLNDLKKYEGLRSPAKASAMECLLVRSVSPMVLHPNPDDEFSMEEIGPNYEIISNYVKQFRINMQCYDKLMDEPLMVEKMNPDGYMLINGHHRWFAALQMRLKKVPVKIINLVHEEELKAMLESSLRDKRAVFDLDEVLFAGEQDVKTEKAPMLSFHKEKLRIYVPIMMKELNKMGYDIWVYTAGYLSAEYIESFFRSYHVKVDGIVNGTRQRRKTQKEEMSKIKKEMSKKYRETLHIDRGHILRVQSWEKDYDYITLKFEEDGWVSEVVKTVRTFQ